MSVTTFRGAVIGCGFVSRHHLDGWKQVPGAEIVAVCDPRPERLASALERMGPGAQGFADARTLWDHAELDFVEICTGPEAHRTLVEQAAARGIHVLCQKPAASTRADLLAMIDACDSAGVRLMIHEHWRFRPWYRVARRLLDEGRIGRPIRLRLAHRDTRALRPQGFADQPFLADRSELILLEIGCHLIDVARFLMGEVADVSARTGKFGSHVGEDVATLSLRFDSGTLGLLDMSWCAPAETARPAWALNETVIEGTTGTLRLRTDGSWDIIDPDGRTECLVVDVPGDDAEVYLQAYVAAQRHFLEGIRRGTPFETDGSDTLRTMDIVWTAYRSAIEGRTLIVDGLTV